MELIDIIKALAHENRLRILNLLKKEKLCVCEIRNILEINQSNASRHLIKLKQVKLIISEQEAQWVYYKLNQKQINKYPFVSEIIKKELEIINFYQEDIKKLSAYKDSGISCEQLDDCNLF